MPFELGSDTLPSFKRFSFIGFRQYLKHHGVDAGAIRYRATASLAHPAGELSGVSLTELNGKPLLTVDVSLMGLYGTTSPLPAFYTERVLGLGQRSVSDLEQKGRYLEGEHEAGEDLKQFYDLFNHQAIALFYDAWCKYRIAHRLADDSHNNEFTTALLALWGIDRTRLASLKHLTLARLIPLAGLLASRTASISVLEQALNRLFNGVNIQTQSMVCGVVNIPQDQLNGLGVENAVLGESLVLGQAVINCSGLTVSVFLNDPSEIHQWLPGGEHNETARELIALMLNAPNDVQLTLRIGHAFDDLSAIGHSSRGLGWGVGLGVVHDAVINI